MIVYLCSNRAFPASGLLFILIGVYTTLIATSGWSRESWKMKGSVEVWLMKGSSHGIVLRRIIGVGAVVINDIPDNITAVGVPTRVIK